MHLDSIWGTGGNTFTSDLQPLHETNNSSMATGSLKEEDSLTAAGEEGEGLMAHPRTFLYAEVQEEVVLATEETMLLEEPIVEHLS